MRPSRGRTTPPPGQPAREWVGGRLHTPFYITDADPPYRPDMILWLELPDDLVVASAVLDPNSGPGALARTLLDAFAKPLAGPPRRPRRIRVANEADAAEVRAAVGSGTEVVVAPTPELRKLMEAMAEDMSGEEPSYFEHGKISSEVVANLFLAGRVLHAAAPWKRAGDQQTLRMDIPALGVEGACVSIIGALGQNLGVIVFPSQTAFDAFLDAAEVGPRSEGPVDVGTTTLSLTFERAEDLPPSMRREALAKGWPVAGPDAYPVVAHRDRDGVPRPLTERDVRIVTACALAVTAFSARHGHIFLADRFEPVSATYTGDDEIAVRLTAPYEGADLSEPAPQLGLFPDEGPRRPVAGPAATVAGKGAGAAAPEPRRLSRNAPCWCGSGKKYKRCHLDADRAEGEGGKGGEARSTQPAPVHSVDERLVWGMARFATARFGAGWSQHAERAFVDAESAVQLFLPWAVYHVPVDGRAVVDWFVAEEGRRLSPEEQSWLQAQRAAWLGVWEVLEVAPGRGLDVRELLTGAERRVAEVRGSRVLVARDAVLGRVVDHEGLSVFAGIHPRPLAPEDAAEVVRAVRGRVRRRREIPVERLREPAVERYLIARWEEGVAAMDARAAIPPILHNTDGDELLFTKDHFAFDPAARGAVAAALASIEGLEGPDEDDGGKVYTFVRPESAADVLPGGTVLGRVRLAAGRLTLETNSVARADQLRKRLEAACGKRLQHRAREHTSPEALARSGDRDVAEPAQPEQPPPEVERALAEWIDRYYAAWLDQKVPALGGLTPRQAARTPRGRERLDVLLKDMENRAARWPRGREPDVARLRAELRMED